MFASFISMQFQIQVASYTSDNSSFIGFNVRLRPEPRCVRIMYENCSGQGWDYIKQECVLSFRGESISSDVNGTAFTTWEIKNIM